MRRNGIIALLGGALLVVMGAGIAGAGEAERKCEAGKYKCMAGIGSGLVGCYAKDSSKPGAVPGLPECITKVTTKFNGGATVLYSYDAISQYVSRYGGSISNLAWREVR